MGTYDLAERQYQIRRYIDYGDDETSAYDSCRWLQAHDPEEAREAAEHAQRARTDALCERAHTPTKYLGGTEKEQIDEVHRGLFTPPSRSAGR
jgi:hypothetical protein